MDRNYKGLIWTNHALERMEIRGVSQGDAWATWRRPDQTRYGREKGVWVYYRTWGSQRVEVVAKKNPSASSGQAGKWIILSVWSRRVFAKRSLKTEKKSFLKILLNSLLGRGKG
jgi:hypothetical protein